MATQGRRGRRGEAGPPGGDGEFRSGPIAGTAIVSGVTFAQKGLQYAEVDGLAIFEGDIVLGTAAELQAQSDAGMAPVPLAGVGITGQQFRWPAATVPFDIDPNLPNQQRVTDAIAHWEANTRIRFVQRTAANAAQHPDFVHFQPGNGCSSFVGRRQTGQQNITLAAGCPTGSTIHEIGHAVGLWHEQSREDRDSFVRIEFANIDPAMQHNFSQHIADGDDLGPYDYGSIMHYPTNAFSVNGQATIVALQPLPAGVTLGQRNGLSAGDIAAVHMMYPAPTIKEVPKDPIKDIRKEPVADPTIKEIRKDPITDPPTFKEIRKDPISDPTIKEIRKDPITDPPTLKEVAKDPVSDPGPTTFKEVAKDPAVDPRPTVKEVGRDPFPGGGGTFVEITPIPIPGQEGGGGAYGGQMPFVLAGPSRAPGAMGQALAEAANQVDELAAAVIQAEQQHGELLAAWTAAVQALEALEQGQG
jgi:hypothetical protein